MKISDVLRTKGTDVVTVSPDQSVGELLALLADHQIGAVVVSSDGEAVEGIVSERDVVRRLHSEGASIIEAPVSQIMTKEVRTVTPADGIAELAVTMTEHRFRHVPVVEDGRLIAIVSIGDVVKHRLRTLSAERDQLEAYITQ
ncbi:CBS domain-containing protein [Janibacter sp. GXQ6167]|uniref:CBS domain-containing protein n=1 Tax=Janibacter sp. GXQ6167 TaxID=3240791 RepID=UPI003524781C